MPLINCEIELDLSWSRYCFISEISRTPTVPANQLVLAVDATQIIWTTFQINNARLYVSVDTLPINDNITFLENIKPRFKRTISWNKYRSEITTQPKNNNLYYLIDPILIDGLYFHWKMLMLILQDILLIGITCH